MLQKAEVDITSWPWQRFVICAVALVTCIKVLFVRTYLSTDFDVHRNWLAITYHLPISKWYFEDTSEWTLDYPPFFAYIEYILSHAAIYILGTEVAERDLLGISAEPIRNLTAVYFQRATVILTDLVYVYALLHYFRSKKQESVLQWMPLFAILLSLPGLLMVDHIHCQYNGILMGILVLSISYIVEGSDLKGALMFAIALNFKHLFLYVAPVYFVYLFKHYCFPGLNATAPKSAISYFSLTRLVTLGSVVLFIFGISFGPFILLNQIPQVISRLFPFGRGLCHAYWAPNFWALYNIADKVAIFAHKAMGIPIANYQVASMTGGLVGETAVTHLVLPSIKPPYTMALVLISLVPMMVQLWKLPTKRMFLLSMVYSSMCFYMFGWHVHEKAILTAIIPLWLLASEGVALAKISFFLSTVGHYSLFPLLFELQELPIRNLLLVLHVSLSYTWITYYYESQQQKFALNKMETLYLCGLVFVELFSSVIHPLYYVTKYPFLALMITSVYCAVGVGYSYLLLFVQLFKIKN